MNIVDEIINLNSQQDIISKLKSLGYKEPQIKTDDQTKEFTFATINNEDQENNYKRSSVYISLKSGEIKVTNEIFNKECKRVQVEESIIKDSEIIYSSEEIYDNQGNILRSIDCSLEVEDKDRKYIQTTTTYDDKTGNPKYIRTKIESNGKIVQIIDKNWCDENRKETHYVATDYGLIAQYYREGSKSSSIDPEIFSRMIALGKQKIKRFGLPTFNRAIVAGLRKDMYKRKDSQEVLNFSHSTPNSNQSLLKRAV